MQQYIDSKTYYQDHQKDLSQDVYQYLNTHQKIRKYQTFLQILFEY